MKNSKCAVRTVIIAMIMTALFGVSSFAVMEKAYAYVQKPSVTAEDPTTGTETEPTDPTNPTEPEPPAKNGWDGDSYYKDGIKVTGHQSIDNNLYYFDNDGLKQTEVHSTYNSKLYYFGQDGTGKVFSGTYKSKVYKSGVLLTGVSGSYYYKNGVRYTGTAGKYYYKNGLKYTGTVGGRYYKSGVKYSGVKSNYYYKSGVKQTKYKSRVAKMDNGKIYYFTKTGRVSSTGGWKRYNSKRYYFRSGTALTGWNYVGSYKYYFSSNGILSQDLIARFGKSWMKKDLIIKVNRAKNCITIYARDGKKGYTIPVKAITCSVGKSGTPTVKGTYYISKGRTYRWHKLGGPSMGGYCYGQYCSRITGGYLFHSVNYRSPNKRTLSAKEYNKLGQAASHGCIRLQTVNAKLLYDIANYRKTKVIIYDSSVTGPFDKPVVKKIPLGQNYDPTDPTI